MKITKEMLNDRRANLLAQREQHIANLNAVNGALQAVDALIAECDKPETDPSAAPVTPPEKAPE